MKPLIAIYWTRFGIGVVAGVISTFVSILSGIKPGVYDVNSFLNGLTVALLVYLASYYIIKSMFSSKVEKQSKIMSMGIGIYFFTWIVVWVFLFSIWNGQVA
jgi:ABC-type transport system involved in multi-copper enzyme maturation permease subunit